MYLGILYDPRKTNPEEDLYYYLEERYRYSFCVDKKEHFVLKGTLTQDFLLPVCS